MLKPCPSRWFYFSQFLFIVGLLLMACCLEYYQGLVPCALCLVQRVVYASLGVMLVIATLLPARKYLHIMINFFLCLVAALGILFAGRQVWLQYIPSSLPLGGCDANLFYLFKILPFTNFIGVILLGGPECAKVDWKFLGLSLAAWSLLCFLGFFLLALLQGLGYLFTKTLHKK